MNIADDLACAFNDGYEKGKADAETYLLYCGDTDKPQTNADRIRSMTDEELAEFIANSTSCETCVVRKGGSDGCQNTNCSTAWLDWLKQEVDDGD